MKASPTPEMASEERKHRPAGKVILRSFKSFLAQDPFQLSAALSYYSLLSIAPLLLVLTGIFGLLIDEDWFRDQIVRQGTDLVGPSGGEMLTTVMNHSQESTTGLWSLLIGIGLTFIGATTVFAQLQSALNRMFDVVAQPRNAMSGFVRARLISFTVVLGVGFLMLISLFASAMITGLQEYAANWLEADLLWRIANIALTFGLLTFFIAMLFKYVPDVQLEWRDTWLGAATTAVLFSFGKFAIGLYLGNAGVGSAFGAAGSAVVFMAWIYYASLILFLGAAVTREIAGRAVPAEHAQ